MTNFYFCVYNLIMEVDLTNDKIGHIDFNFQIDQAILHMVRYKNNIITRSELINTLDLYNSIVSIKKK